jgi:hypothetical protein
MVVSKSPFTVVSNEKARPGGLSFPFVSEDFISPKRTRKSEEEELL